MVIKMSNKKDLLYGKKVAYLKLLEWVNEQINKVNIAIHEIELKDQAEENKNDYSLCLGCKKQPRIKNGLCNDCNNISKIGNEIGDICSMCQQGNLIVANGCNTCNKCGFATKCGL